jgi:uncharacterized protein
MRILFVTDLHGSTLVLEKAVEAARVFSADTLLVGGDVSGKRLVPILEREASKWLVCEPYKQKDDSGKSTDVSSLEIVPSPELPTYLSRLEAKGYYWQQVTEEELSALNEDAERSETLFQEKIYGRLCKWADYVSTKLPTASCCFWTGGNDDDDTTLSRLKTQDLGRFQYVEGEVVALGDYELASIGYSNPTPFYTARELPEPALLEKLEGLVQLAHTSDRLILNVHVPPHNSGHLDLCLNPDDPSESIHVGSTAVRTFIENTQPIADFVGHVHEGKGTFRIDRTYIFNPGSEYNAGVLHGVVVDIKQAKIKDYLHFTR